ncbi:MAG: homoserine kinase [Solirubrobacterales bacterium]
MGRKRKVRVPASSANLGPGYDAMAAAVSLYMELEVEETGEFSVDTGGLRLPTDENNLCVRAFAELHTTDEIAFRISSEIPPAGGLGSSGAAIVAGLVAADHMFELGLEKEELFDRANRIEGHPDNVGASLYGGFVICDGGEVAQIEPPSGLEAIAVVPEEPVSTAAARAALPPEIPIGEVSYNIAHASLLALGLARGDLALISRGLHDRIHQPRREHLYPRSIELVGKARELGALGATISGAGPTVLVWCYFEQTGEVVEALRTEVAGWAEVKRLNFVAQGADVTNI